MAPTKPGAVSPTIQRVALSDDQWVDMETRPTGRDVMRMEQLQLQDRPSTSDDPADMDMIAISIRAWSFDGDVTGTALLDLYVDDLFTITSFWAGSVFPFLERWTERANQNSSLKHLSEVVSRQPINGRKSSSSRGGRGKTSSTRPKSK